MSGIQESATFSEPLRPWLPVDLLDNAARTIAENKAVMLGLPVLGGLALTAVQVGLTQLVVPGGVAEFFAADGGGGVTAAIGAVYVVDIVLFTIVSTLLSGIIALAAVRSQLGVRVGARELLRLILPAVPALAGVAVLLTVILAVAMLGWVAAMVGSVLVFREIGVVAIGILLAVLIALAGFVGMVFVSVRLTLCGTVVLLEGRRAPDVGLYVPGRVGVAGALKRSWYLVRGRFWRVFGIMLFAGLVIYIVGYALQLGLTLLVATLVAWTESSEDGGADVMSIAIGASAGVSAVLITIASLAFLSAVQALIYLDLRVRREGLDLWLRPALLPSTRPGQRA